MDIAVLSETATALPHEVATVPDCKMVLISVYWSTDTTKRTVSVDHSGWQNCEADAEAENVRGAEIQRRVGMVGVGVERAVGDDGIQGVRQTRVVERCRG